MSEQYRQGDVLLRAIDRIPSGARPVPGKRRRVVVAEGELTGHAHAFATGDVKLLRDNRSRRSFLRIPAGGAPLSHEEHATILVPQGRYEVLLQREYAPRAPRRVRD
jgi:hypothetical protein